jgi:streptogramin lyase
VVTTFAGNPYQGNVTNGSLAVARFAGPVGIAINAAGDLYVSEWNGNDIREITFGQ